jgi:signal transduction histidine kinase
MPPTVRRSAADRPPTGQARARLRPGASHPMPGSVPSRRGLKAAAAAVAIVAGVAGLALLLPGFPVAARSAISAWVYPPASMAAGLVLVSAAVLHRGRRRWAWLLVGLGVVSWGVAEVGWQSYLAAGREVPYPSWLDVFYLVAYPLVGAGVLLLPRFRLGKFERARSLLDAGVGVTALSLVLWITYLDKAVVFDSGLPFLENWVNVLYPIGDLVLLLTVMALAFRRTDRRFGPELFAVGAALLLNAVADLAYFALAAADSYADGSWLDGLWLLGYAAFAAAAWAILRPTGSATTPHSRDLRRVIVAYGPVVALPIAILLYGVPNLRMLTIFGAVLVALAMTRQWVATREMKEVAERQRDAVLASVSHGLRTPLTAVQGYAQLLRADWARLADDERRQMMGDIEEQALHLGRVVTDIIDLTRGQTSSVRLSRSPQPVAPQLQIAVHTLPPAVQEHVIIEADPRLLVDADKDRLQQILVNLLTNAIRYGRKRILVGAQRQGPNILFQVHDDGPGVPKRYEAAIWQRFERGAHRGDSAVDGLGIGLPITRALVEAHGGTTHQHRSDRYGGACFEFTIPVPEPDGPGAHPAPALASAVA